MNKKYYDGEIVNNVLIKNTYDAGQYLKLIKAFSKEKGVDVKADDYCSKAERGNNEAD